MCTKRLRRKTQAPSDKVVFGAGRSVLRKSIGNFRILNLESLCPKSGHTRSSLCNLCVLCASVVHYCSEKTTTETQSTQRLHREEAEQRLFVQSWFDLDAADDFGPLSAGILRDDMVAFDHAIEGLPIDAQNARRCLLISTSVLKYARHVSPFNFRERDPFFVNNRLRLLWLIA